MINLEEFSDTDFISAGSFTGNRQIGFHSHEGSELVLVSAGTCEIEVDGFQLRGGKGTLFILPAKTDHNQTNYGMVSTVYTKFIKGKNFSEYPRIIMADNWLFEWMTMISRMAETVNEGLNNLASGILYSVIQRIAQLENVSNTQEQIHPALVQAIRYIEEKVDQALNLDSIARHAGISPSYLSGLFRQQFNQGPIAYTLDLKMKLARRMLKDSYLSVKEISARCGFNDSNYFCRMFRKYNGVSPGCYRSQLS